MSLRFGSPQCVHGGLGELDRNGLGSDQLFR